MSEINEDLDAEHLSPKQFLPEKRFIWTAQVTGVITGALYLPLPTLSEDDLDQTLSRFVFLDWLQATS
jgi:hypothetical protein